jgi:cell division protein FtsB
MAGRRLRRADRSLITSRAAVLAVVLCAVALSLAYPLREYLAQRHQIDQLQAEHATLLHRVATLRHEQGRLADPTFLEHLAMQRLGLCLPGATCYLVVRSGHVTGGRTGAATDATPWYDRLWSSVQQANRGAR